MSEPSLSAAGWAVVYASAMGAAGAIVAQWLGKRMDWRRARDREDVAAKANEREEIRLGYEGIIARLQEDQSGLRTMFREMQEAVAICERERRIDAVRIADLERQNEEQARRILNLERSTPQIADPSAFRKHG